MARVGTAKVLKPTSKVTFARSGTKRKPDVSAAERPVKRPRITSRERDEDRSSNSKGEDREVEEELEDDELTDSSSETEDHPSEVDKISLEQEMKDIAASAKIGGSAMGREGRAGRGRREFTDDVIREPVYGSRNGRGSSSGAETTEHGSELVDASEGEDSRNVNGKGKGKERAVEAGTDRSSRGTGSGSSKKQISKATEESDSDDPFDRPPSRKRSARNKNYNPPRPKTQATVNIRRILEERKVGKKTYYLVDWVPGWVEPGKIVAEKKEEWNGNKQDHTIAWGRDTVYKINNPTSDDSNELILQVLESVFQMYREYMNPETAPSDRTVEELAAELFQDDDWVFHEDDPSKGEENSAEEAAVLSVVHNDTSRISAGDVMRRTFTEAWTQTVDGSDGPFEHEYEKIKVHYCGEIDEQSGDQQLQPPEGKFAPDFIHPIFAAELWDPAYMRPHRWNAINVPPNEQNRRYQTIAECVARMVRNCPYLFAQPWPLAFISLFFRDNQISDLIKASEFEFRLAGVGDRDDNDSWASRVMDTIIYTYLDECQWEQRCMDEVWQSYREAQELIDRAISEANESSNGDSDDDTDIAFAPIRGSNGKGKAGSRDESGENDDEDEDEGPAPPRGSRASSTKNPRGRDSGRKELKLTRGGRKVTSRPDNSAGQIDNGEGSSKAPLKKKLDPKKPAPKKPASTKGSASDAKSVKKNGGKKSRRVIEDDDEESS